jgi:hypothetical protein
VLGESEGLYDGGSEALLLLDGVDDGLLFIAVDGVKDLAGDSSVDGLNDKLG